MRKLIYISLASFFAASCLTAMPARAEYVSTGYSTTNPSGYGQNQEMAAPAANFHESNRGISAADTIMATNPGETDWNGYKREKRSDSATSDQYSNSAATATTADMTSPNATASTAMTSPNAVYQSSATAPAEGTPQASASNSGGSAASSATSSNS